MGSARRRNWFRKACVWLKVELPAVRVERQCEATLHLHADDGDGACGTPHVVKDIWADGNYVIHARDIFVARTEPVTECCLLYRRGIPNRVVVDSILGARVAPEPC